MRDEEETTALDVVREYETELASFFYDNYLDARRLIPLVSSISVKGGEPSRFLARARGGRITNGTAKYL